MKPLVKVSVVLVGYVVAFAITAAVIAVYVAATNGPARQSSGGMSAFGDSLLFIAVLMTTPRKCKRSRTALLLGWVAICLFGGSAQMSATPGSLESMSQIRATSRALIEAQLRYDAPAVAQLLTKDFVYIGNDGSVASKQEFLPSAKDRTLRPLQALEWELRQVQFYGNTAVAIYSIHEKSIENGKPHEFRGRSLATWVKENGRWLCAAIHD